MLLPAVGQPLSDGGHRELVVDVRLARSTQVHGCERELTLPGRRSGVRQLVIASLRSIWESVWGISRRSRRTSSASVAVAASLSAGLWLARRMRRRVPTRRAIARAIAPAPYDDDQGGAVSRHGDPVSRLTCERKVCALSHGVEGGRWAASSAGVLGVV